MEAGFTQSDVAYWAQTGTGLWEGQPAVDKLRLIANLYPESIHLVSRADAGIDSVADLKGKRVSLDEPGSGTLPRSSWKPMACRKRTSPLNTSSLTRRPTGCATVLWTHSSL